MPFIPDLQKTRHEVLFSRKNSKITQPSIYFNNIQVQRANQRKNLGIIPYEKLIFKAHIDKVLAKTSEGIAAIKCIRNFLPCKSLITIYMKQLLDQILTMKIFCTTNLITLLFVEQLNLLTTKQLLQLLVRFKVPPKKNF